jgi:hypothetical protein
MSMSMMSMSMSWSPEPSTGFRQEVRKYATRKKFRRSATDALARRHEPDVPPSRKPIAIKEYHRVIAVESQAEFPDDFSSKFCAAVGKLRPGRRTHIPVDLGSRRLARRSRCRSRPLDSRTAAVMPAQVTRWRNRITMSLLRKLRYHEPIPESHRGACRSSGLEFNCNGAAANSPLWHPDSCTQRSP